jgi:DNA polymerase/3'-5' exonuclease PolX
MKLEEAKKIADRVVEEIKPFCDKIEIAGSIRRQKEDVGDIEIVCIPTSNKAFEFKTIVDKWKKVKGDALGKYTQRILPEGIKLDLFIANRDNYGLILLIRTGSAEFSKWIIGVKLPEAGYKCRGGYLWNKKGDMMAMEEEDIFKLANINYCPPERR